MDSEYSIPQLSFGAAVLICGFLTVRVCIPPNQTPADRAWRSDLIRFAASSLFINLVVLGAAMIVPYTAALVVTDNASTRARICPSEGTGQRNPAAFAWSPLTAASCLAILIGAPLRLGAYTGLGKNFTFGLAKPSGLVTSGIYSYVQHPSYTGIWLVAIGSFVLFLRLDGPAACFVPPSYWPLVQAWSTAVYAGAGLVLVQSLSTRVRQEEAMLKELFGKEWEEWHAKTSRFVPGLF